MDYSVLFDALLAVTEARGFVIGRYGETADAKGEGGERTRIYVTGISAVLAEDGIQASSDN